MKPSFKGKDKLIFYYYFSNINIDDTY